MENISSSDPQSIYKLFSSKAQYRKEFTLPVAAFLFNSIHNADKLKFLTLSANEKSFWLDYADGIPTKLLSLNLVLKRFSGYCKTCIITDNEMEALVQSDMSLYFHKTSLKIRNNENNKAQDAVMVIQGIADQATSDEIKKFFTNLSFLIPSALKLVGFELAHLEEISEISDILIRKLARAIHAKYLHDINMHKSDPSGLLLYPGITKHISNTGFDDLPDDIKYSNYDNAAHIPTKLLSIGYKIRKVKKGFRPYALHLNDEEVETMAIVEHLRWSWEKRLNGWKSGPVRDDENKIHPSLIPYDQLSDAEKKKDRELVKLIPAFLHDLDYEVYPVSPNRLKKLSYSIKPRSNINKILDETRKLNEQIRNMVSLTPAVEEMIILRNNKIEEAIIEIEDSYNYAQDIQQAFLPDELFIRECFSESFVLNKPKDVVSGDFYFFSKVHNIIIFSAADCTGHGIPGALISTIGYGILDQAVNELNLTDPADILHHLYSRVHRFLRENEEGTDLSDDMDIVLCALDTSNNVLSFSGVKNPLYRVTDGEVKVYKARNFTESGNHRESPQVPEKIQLSTGDSIYLCSDGYIDQFGGQDHKKYGGTRLKAFLPGIQGYTMPEQSDLLNEEIELWREANNEDQTDDILVIGIRI